MRKRNLLPRSLDHGAGHSSTLSKRTGSFAAIQPPAGAGDAGGFLGRRVPSLVVATLAFVTAVVVELSALAPATAHAHPNPVTAYVTNHGSNTVTPIDVTTNTPGTPITVGTDPRGIAITP